MITFKQALALKRGDILIDERSKRWKVTGKVQTWKTDANRIRVPLKHGLYVYDSIDGWDFDNGVCERLTLEAEQ